MDYGMPYEAEHPHDGLRAEFNFKTDTILEYTLLNSNDDIVFQETFYQNEVEVNEMEEVFA